MTSVIMVIVFGHFSTVPQGPPRLGALGKGIHFVTADYRQWGKREALTEHFNLV